MRMGDAGVGADEAGRAAGGGGKGALGLGEMARKYLETHHAHLRTEQWFMATRVFPLFASRWVYCFSLGVVVCVCVTCYHHAFMQHWMFLAL